MSRSLRLYADHPRVLAVQVVADLAVLVWVVLWCWLGTVVHDGIEALTAPGERLSSAADGLSGSLRDAGGALGGTPLVGDEVAAPFESAADASDAMGDAGDQSVAAVERLAWWSGLVVAVAPVVLVARRWLPWRVGWARQAQAADRVLAAVRRGEADLELFAWRAVATQPLHRLVRVSDDPAGALRRRDPRTVAALAALELDALGLAVPPPARPQPAGTAPRA